MFFDDVEFVGGELTRLGNNGVGNADLAPVMHGRGVINVEDFGSGQAYFFRQQRLMAAHPNDMAAGEFVLVFHKSQTKASPGVP